jgi:hypothetical protein
MSQHYEQESLEIYDDVFLSDAYPYRNARNYKVTVTINWNFRTDVNCRNSFHIKDHLRVCQWLKFLELFRRFRRLIQKFYVRYVSPPLSYIPSCLPYVNILRPHSIYITYAFETATLSNVRNCQRIHETCQQVAKWRDFAELVNANNPHVGRWLYVLFIPSPGAGVAQSV